MCRIAAVVRRTENDSLYFYPDLIVDILLNLSDKQHRDGFGMFLQGSGEIYKKSLPCSSIVNTPEFVQWLGDNNWGNEAVLAHVRQASVGRSYNLNDLARDNLAHPFTSGNLTLVHNGHLANSFDVKKKFNLSTDLVVDSEIFLKVLEIKSKDKPLTYEVIQETVNEFIGPFVIIVHENIPDRESGFWILMGKSRTMHYYESEDAFIFCTEAGIREIINRNLGRAAAMGWIKYTPVEKVFRLNQDRLYRIDPNGLRDFGELKSIEEVEKQLPKVIPVMNVNTRVQNSVTPNAEDISLANICLKVSLRDKILKHFLLSEDDLDELLMNLSPLMKWRVCNLEAKDFELLYDFLEKLEYSVDVSFESLTNPRKQVLWKDIVSLTNHPYQDCIQIYPTFESPYFINEIYKIEKCLDKIRENNKIRENIEKEVKDAV